MRDQAHALMIATLALACSGHALDAGWNPIEEWRDIDERSGAAQTLYKGRLQIHAVTSEGDRIYVIMGSARGPLTTKIVSCPYSRCESELQSLSEYELPHLDTPYGGAGLHVANSVLYWISSTGIWVCAKEGCPEGPELVEEGSLGSLTTDDEFVYWTTFTGDVKRRRHGMAEIEYVYRAPTGSLPLPRLGRAVGDHLYLYDEKRIARLAKNGQAKLEILVEELNISSVAVAQDRIYFTRRMLTGAVLSCPVAGCLAGPQVLTEQRWPADLQIRSGTATWLNAGPSVSNSFHSYEISSCSLPECAVPRTRVQDVSITYDGELSVIHHVAVDGFLWFGSRNLGESWLQWGWL